MTMPHLPSLSALPMMTPATVGAPHEYTRQNVHATDCVICMNSMAGAPTYATSCGHWFHEGCLRTWARSHNTCPSCRAELELGHLSEMDELSDSEIEDNWAIYVSELVEHEPSDSEIDDSRVIYVRRLEEQTAVLFDITFVTANGRDRIVQLLGASCTALSGIIQLYEPAVLAHVERITSSDTTTSMGTSVLDAYRAMCDSHGHADIGVVLMIDWFEDGTPPDARNTMLQALPNATSDVLRHVVKTFEFYRLADPLGIMSRPLCNALRHIATTMLRWSDSRGVDSGYGEMTRQDFLQVMRAAVSVLVRPDTEYIVPIF